MTSSWYRLPRCVISMASAAVMTSSVMPAPSCAVSSVSIGRTRLPPASSRYRVETSAIESANRTSSIRPASTLSMPSSIAFAIALSAAEAKTFSLRPRLAASAEPRRATGWVGFTG